MATLALMGAWPAPPPVAADLVPLDLEHAPAAAASPSFAGRTLSILPIAHHVNPLDRVRNPQRDLREVAPADLERVLGVHYNMGGRALEIFMGRQAADGTLREALEAEALALGMRLIPPPVASLTAGTDILSVFNGRSEPEMPDLALMCSLNSFYVDMGPFQRGFQKHPAYAVRTWMRAQVVVFAPRTRQVLWKGSVTEQSQYEVATRGGARQQVHKGFARFISGFLRENPDLGAALRRAGPEDVPDRVR